MTVWRTTVFGGALRAGACATSLLLSFLEQSERNETTYRGVLSSPERGRDIGGLVRKGDDGNPILQGTPAAFPLHFRLLLGVALEKTVQDS